MLLCYRRENVNSQEIMLLCYRRENGEKVQIEYGSEAH